MFLSRLLLNPRSRQVRREAAEPYEMHRTLMRAFGPREDAGRVLFRLDAPRDGGPLALLVQSRSEPDWSHHAALADYLLEPPDKKSFDPGFATGQVLRFRLRANPTVKRDGKRLGLLKEEEQLAWLSRKGEAGGFKVLGAAAVEEGFRGGRKDDGEHRHRLTHLAVRFDGVLKVTDAGRLLETVRDGVGSGKAFGFGLLSLARAED
jgi:CRISPR system Cascade subunit CasE